MSGRYTARDVARILKLPEDRLRPCLRAALFPSTRTRTFSFQDLLLLKTTKGLLDARIPIARIRRMLQSLRRQLPPGQPLAGLRIYADGRRIVVWDAAGRWHPDSGQFLFEFEAQAVAREVRRLPAGRSAGSITNRVLTAEEWVDLGAELERQSPTEAAEAYRQALSLEPRCTAAQLNLGRLLQEAGQLVEAEACFRTALRYAPDEPLAHLLLGRLLEHRGDTAAAMAAYRRAVELDRRLQEAHHRLGLLCEAAGMKTEAIRHLAEAQRLTRPRQPRQRRRDRE